MNFVWRYFGASMHHIINGGVLDVLLIWYNLKSPSVKPILVLRILVLDKKPNVGFSIPQVRSNGCALVSDLTSKAASLGN